MGKLGIFEDERSKYFQFDEDTEVLIKVIGKEDLTAINRKAEKISRTAGGDASTIFNRVLGEKTVLGWRNIYDHNHPGLIVKNQPLPFTPQNRDMLMKKSIEFSTFVNSTCTNSALFMDDEDTDVKND